MKNIISSLSPPGQIVPMAVGIWSKKLVKFAVLSWRLWWGLINTFMVRSQTEEDPNTILLCVL